MIKNKKKFTSVFLLSNLFLYTVVFAAKYYTVDGITYTNRSAVSISSSRGAAASVTLLAPRSLPAGYLGVQAKLYNGDGDISHTSDWFYSPNQASGLQHGTDYDNAVNTYRASGNTRVYRGNNYHQTSTNFSPYLNYNGRNFPITEEYDEYEEYVEEEFIRAVGVNNVRGYVKSEDIRGDMPSSPEEALANQEAMMRRGTPRVIPLYDEDKVTIIGQFEISVPKYFEIFE